MLIIETSIFTRQIDNLLDAHEYRLLQIELYHRPGTGDIIPGSGGIRKMRWGLGSQGKRGGLRILYYFIDNDDVIYMLLAYKKSKQEDLTPKQMKKLKKLVEKELHSHN